LNNFATPTDEQINKLYDELKSDARNSGYHLNPDEAFAKDLARGLLVNEARYGYRACPCRLALGDEEDEQDITCPCDYRDADVNEYGSCYCALYISQDIVDGKKEAGPIPERRPDKKQRNEVRYGMQEKAPASELALPVYRCSVCGYLCAREQPPEVCPICKADKKRFQRFM
jgi:ferredoxin-thioredoxin reductase catalytic subunit